MGEPSGQDIHAISHEMAEWANDPFVNKVEPWLTPTAPQYGCTSVLETGYRVVGVGFAKGTDPQRSSCPRAGAQPRLVVGIARPAAWQATRAKCA